MLAVTRKRQVAPQRLLQTRSTFTKSLMVSMGVYKLGRMDLISTDARVKINGTYYHKVLLTPKLLPVMNEICGEFFIFQQGIVPAHRACKTINILEQDNNVRSTRSFVTQQHRSEPGWLQNMREMQQRV